MDNPMSAPNSQEGMELQEQEEPMFDIGGTLHSESDLIKAYPKEYEMYKMEHGGVLPQHGFGSWLGKNAGKIGAVVGGVGGFLVGGPAGAALGAAAGSKIGGKIQSKHEAKAAAAEGAAAGEGEATEGAEGAAVPGGQYALVDHTHDDGRAEASAGQFAVGGQIPIWGRRAEMMDLGGGVKKPEFEAEGGEVIQGNGLQVFSGGGNPHLKYYDSNSAKIVGNKHKATSADPNSGVKMSSSPATSGRIFSKKLKNPKTKQSFADDAHKLLTKVGKYDKILRDNEAESIAAKTATIMSDKLNAKLDGLFDAQELFKQEQGLPAQPGKGAEAVSLAKATEQGMEQKAYGGNTPTYIGSTTDLSHARAKDPKKQDAPAQEEVTPEEAAAPEETSSTEGFEYQKLEPMTAPEVQQIDPAQFDEGLQGMNNLDTGLLAMQEDGGEIEEGFEEQLPVDADKVEPAGKRPTAQEYTQQRIDLVSTSSNKLGKPFRDPKTGRRGWRYPAGEYDGKYRQSRIVYDDAPEVRVGTSKENKYYSTPEEKAQFMAELKSGQRKLPATDANDNTIEWPKEMRDAATAGELASADFKYEKLSAMESAPLRLKSSRDRSTLQPLALGGDLSHARAKSTPAPQGGEGKDDKKDMAKAIAKKAIMAYFTGGAGVAMENGGMIKPSQVYRMGGKIQNTQKDIDGIFDLMYGGPVPQHAAGAILGMVGQGIGALSGLPTMIHDFRKSKEDPYQWEGQENQQAAAVEGQLAGAESNIGRMEGVAGGMDVQAKKDFAKARGIYDQMGDLDISQQRSDIRDAAGSQMGMLRGGSGSRAEMLAGAQNVQSTQARQLGAAEAYKDKFDQDALARKAAGITGLGQADASLQGQKASLFGQAAGARGQVAGMRQNIGMDEMDRAQYIEEMNRQEVADKEALRRNAWKGVGNTISDVGGAVGGIGFGLGG